MEALAALSLACNIFQALDFTYNLVKGGIYLVSSRKESLPESTTASALATDLQTLIAKIQTSSTQSTIDPQLQQLCEGCNKITEELLLILNSLRVTKKRQLVAKLIRNQLEKKRYTELETQLNHYRSEIQLYITANLSSRVDAQAVKQSGEFKALSAETQASFLSLLTVLEGQTEKITDQISQQDGLLQAARTDIEQAVVSQAENTRQVLSHEQQRTRLHIVSKLQESLDDSTTTNALNVANTAVEIKTANLALQNIVTDTIKVSEQTVHDDINRLRGNLLFVSQQIASTESKLDSLIFQMNRDHQRGETRKELQYQATVLTRIYLSLQALYRELQEILASVMNQALSIFGTVTFEKYFNKQQSQTDIRPSHGDEYLSHNKSAMKRTIAAISNIPSPQAYFSDVGFHNVRLRVAMMKPIRSSRSLRPKGHHRTQCAPPIISAYSQTNMCDEEINTHIITLYHQYCYYPFLPPTNRLLSTRWKHREHRLPNPLEDYRKNIRRHKVVISDEAAVVELARRGDEFIWFMALACAACRACVGCQRGARIIRIVFNVVSDWAEAIRKTGINHSEVNVTSKDAGAIGGSMLRLCQAQDEDRSPRHARKFDRKTALGGRLEEDLILWMKVAETSELCQEVQDFVLSELQWEVPGLGNESADLYASAKGDSMDDERLFDAQIVFFLAYMLMVNRLNMVAVVDAVNTTTASKKQAAFPVLKVPGMIQCEFSIPMDSMALVLAKVLIHFGVVGVQWKIDECGKRRTSRNAEQQVRTTWSCPASIMHTAERRDSVMSTSPTSKPVQRPPPGKSQSTGDDMEEISLC